MTSDHKPVSANFEVKVKATIVDVKMKVYRDIVRHLDKLENESRPSAVMGKEMFICAWFWLENYYFFDVNLFEILSMQKYYFFGVDLFILYWK